MTLPLTAAQVATSGELAELLAEPVDHRQALLTLAPGLHEDVSEDVYHARVHGFASKSALDQFDQSPAHYLAWMRGELDRPSKPRSALRFGKMCHRAILEPEAFAREYVIAPDFGDCRKKENKARRDGWLKEHAGATVIDNDQGMATIGMVRAVVEHPLASRLLSEGASELTLRWNDPETGIACKGRVDHYRRDMGLPIDIKTCENASPAAFSRAVWNYRYDRQDAFYRGGLSVLGAPVDRFLFIAVEKTPPHPVSLFLLDNEASARGASDNAHLLASLRECLEQDRWPSYSDHIETISLPPWATRKDRTS